MASGPGGWTPLNAAMVESPFASDGEKPRPWQACELGPSVHESDPITYCFVAPSQASESAMNVWNVPGTEGAVRMMVKGRAVDCVSRYQSAPNVSPRLSGSKKRAGLNTRSVAAWVGNGPVRSRSKSWGVVSFGSNTSRLTMCVVSWLNVRTPLPMKRIESDSAGGGTQNSLRPYPTLSRKVEKGYGNRN